jgi:hypothetical protein
MKNRNAPENQTTPRILLVACVTALALALTVSRPQPVHAGPVMPPPVPSSIQVPAGNKAFLVGHAVGTQQYICLSPGAPTPWALFGPQATLFDDDDQQIITHFLSPNPSLDDPLGSGTPRPTWQHSKDTSTVWAAPIPLASASVTPGAIPWLLLEVVGAQDGLTDGHKLTATTFIQRLNTSGGTAPSPTDCTEVGKKALVDYEADYFFYKAAKGNADGGN